MVEILTSVGKNGGAVINANVTAEMRKGKQHKSRTHTRTPTHSPVHNSKPCWMSIV